MTDAPRDVNQGPGFGDLVAEEESNPGRLPETFWSLSPVLRSIAQMAHSRKASPEAVLFAVLARLSSQVKPTVRVDPEYDQPATLGWYCGLYGPPSTGKGKAERAAAQLLPFAKIDMARIGLSSGQGLMGAFLEMVDTEDDEAGTDAAGPWPDDPAPTVRGKKGKRLVQVRDRGYVKATEAGTLSRMVKMGGGSSTLDTTLCAAWMSEELATTNAEKERDRFIEEGAYVLGMSLSLQLEPAIELLAMDGIGLPHRIAWANARRPGEDGRPAVRPEVPAPLVNHAGQPLAEWVCQLDQVTVQLPLDALQELDALSDALADGLRDDQPLDGHEPLWRMKAGALLALLHGTTKVTEEYWSAATAMWRASCEVRDGVVREARRRQEAVKAAQRKDQAATAVESATAVYEATHGVHPLVHRVAQNLSRKVTDSGPEGLAQGALGKQVVNDLMKRAYRDSGQDGSLYAEALTYAEAAGWIAAEKVGRTTVIRTGPTPVGSS